ncbi:hypothetical protein RF679_13245 [Undibacterium cyanobacteriorum]|uniref:Uncharacterized protein n=1 Tax=Undibacterium cyanobacteriorum TaxID=3073561 RepID=A0ABY9REG1_9BURK|nr:hypothetical protein [Undibacterium sp. 20NA77.5]WMW79611.1 hypothetical protein RF679_13245 [Undibacterium sp. 20NA77.5]
MKKYFLLVLSLFVSTSSYAECDVSKIISTIVASDGAIIQRDHYHSQFFFPIVDAVVTNKALWLRTLGADFSPVEFKNESGSIELLKVQFLLHVRGMSKDEASFKVKDYQDSRIFMSPHVDERCNFEGKIDLILRKRDGSSEKSEFVVYKPIRVNTK